MIRKLRLRFILVALISVLVVLSATIFSINIYNYSKIDGEAQKSLRQIINQQSQTWEMSYGGNSYMDPGEGGGREGDQRDPGDPGRGNQQEDQMDWLDLYRAHYYVVAFDGEGNINPNRSQYNGVFANTTFDPDTYQFSSETREEDNARAKQVYESNSNSGSIGTLWYRKEKKNYDTYVAFIDVTDKLDNFNNFLLTSVVVSAGSYSVLAGMIIIASFFVFRTSEESYRKQKAFITNASHELKTPLTIINTDLDIIEMDNVKNEWTSSIRDQVSRLVTMTNQLVTLSKLEENDFKNYPFEDFDLSKLANECKEAFAPTYEKNGFKFNVSIKDGLNMHANKYLMNELFYIFLDNALKYTKENGEITLEVKGNKKDAVMIFSNDIKPDDKIDPAQMFERFYRSPSSSKKEGSGIGLSIAKEIINLHKGKVEVALKEGKIIFVLTF